MIMALLILNKLFSQGLAWYDNILFLLSFHEFSPKINFDKECSAFQ